MSTYQLINRTTGEVVADMPDAQTKRRTRVAAARWNYEDRLKGLPPYYRTYYHYSYRPWWYRKKVKAVDIRNELIFLMGCGLMVMGALLVMGH